MREGGIEPGREIYVLGYVRGLAMEIWTAQGSGSDFHAQSPYMAQKHKFP